MDSMFIDKEIKRLEKKVKDYKEKLNNTEKELEKYKELQTITPERFYLACKRHEIEVIQTYIEQGGDVNYIPKDSIDHPVFQVQPFYLDIIDMLLNAGADIKDKTDHFGDSLLHVIIPNITSKNKSIVNKILKQVDVNVENSNKQTPLFWAETKYQAELLVKKGADINRVEIKNRSVLTCAILGGRWEIANYLISLGAKLIVPQK